jgi:hypothetical protein
MLGQSFGSVRPVRGSSEFPPFVLTRPTQLRSDWTRAIVRRWSRRLTNKNSHTFERSISTPCASFNVKKMYRDFVRFSGESDHRPSRVPSPIDGPRPDTHPATAILPRPDTNQPHPPPRSSPAGLLTTRQDQGNISTQAIPGMLGTGGGEWQRATRRAARGLACPARERLSGGDAPRSHKGRQGISPWRFTRPR